jgi:hypothetical protein
LLKVILRPAAALRQRESTAPAPVAPASPRLAETYIDGDACLVLRETHLVATRLRLDAFAVSNGSGNPTAKNRLHGDAADHQGGIETTSVSKDFAPRALRDLVPGCRLSKIVRGTEN